MFPPVVHKLGDLFTHDGHEIRVVGGYVRDTLRGIKPKDLDLATTATPDQVLALCAANDLPYVGDGLKHGTIRIIIDHEMYEVTTLRIDVATDGRHAEVEFTTDWQRDAQRRDFTMNAMSMDLDGTLHDYFEGKRHLDERRVVFVGDAADRIREDYLRILRFFRFCGRMGGADAFWEVRHALRDNRLGLQQISGERIWLEMSKILSGDQFYDILFNMWWIDLFPHMGLQAIDLGDLTSASMARSASDNPITVLAALTPCGEIAETWKLSTPERQLLHFLQGRREQEPTLAYLKDVATSLSPLYALELAALHGPSETLDAIRAWEVPTFPVQGRDLIGVGMAPGPEMGAALRLLEQRWKESDYRLTLEQLIASLYHRD